MSRTEKSSDKFDVAFGVDVITGTFVQVWHHPMDEQDGSFIHINNRGVEVDEDQPVSVKDIIGESAWNYLMGIKARYRLAQENGNPAPNIDAETVSIFLTKLGFAGLGREVRAALD